MGLIILGLIILITMGWHQKIQEFLLLVIIHVLKTLDFGTWATGDPSQWPKWAQ